jgi:beta-1,2-mannobiose phosphorylase / 1,2-beta-oligomannan phosphorylase
LAPDFRLKRLGTIMEPKAGDPHEVEGVLNPAASRARDGQLYLFPRLVARGNCSRIGIARVLFDRNGDPRDVERMGVALEPEADYELSKKGGGCEDPRITYVECGLGNHVVLRGLPGGGRSPTKPVSDTQIPCQQGKSREFFVFSG